MKTGTHAIRALIAADIFGLTCALLLSYRLMGASRLAAHDGMSLAAVFGVAALLLPGWVTLQALTELYTYDLLFDSVEEYSRVIRTGCFGFFIVFGASWQLQSKEVPWRWLFVTWLLCVGAILSSRFAFRRWVYRCRVSGMLTMKSIIVGASEYAVSLARNLRDCPRAGSKPIGFLDDHLPRGTVVAGDLKVLGTPRELKEVAVQWNATEAIVVPDALAWESIQEIIRDAATLASSNLNVRIAPGPYEDLLKSGRVYQKAAVFMVSVNESAVARRAAFFKQVVDLMLAGLLFLLGLPFMAVAALGSRLFGSPRIFERRNVTGLNGKCFTQFRFYTGVPEGNRRTLDRKSLRADAREFCSIVGRVLYMTGFDKSPQLWNVLKCEMSLVGSRPAQWNPQSAEISRTVPISVKPGMTGLWALSHDTGPEFERASTLYYMHNWSVLLDLQILVRTASAAASGRLRYALPRYYHRGGSSKSGLGAPGAVA